MAAIAHRSLLWATLFRGALALLRLRLDEQAEEQVLSNLCAEARVLPEFFLIGEQKAGTTTLSYQLRRNKRIAFSSMDGSPDMNHKELHFFDKGWRHSQGTKFLVSHYPECGQERIIGIDATPQLHTPGVLARIHSTYAGVTNRLKFAIIMREPVARLHSAFHHGVRKKWDNIEQVMPDFRDYYKYLAFLNVTTQDALQGVYDGSEGHAGPIQFLKGSNYVGHIREYYTLFEPSQLLVAPMKLALEPPEGKLPLAEVILSWLGVESSSPTFHPDAVETLNVGSYPALDEELSPEELQNLRRLVHYFASPPGVAKELREGVVLYGYDGDGSVDSKADWLETGW